MPTPGKVAANTALPQPPSTIQNVPANSAPYLRMIRTLEQPLIGDLAQADRLGGQRWPDSRIAHRVRILGVLAGCAFVRQGHALPG
jgi:hypothetical protein